MTTPTTMDTPALAPCPFCGSIGVELFDQAPDEWGYFYIRCHKCQATGPRIDYDPKQGEESARSEAATTWNRRAEPPEISDTAIARFGAHVQALADRYSQNLPSTP
jgi:Lar family restriction alleviation protein